ncbi:purple acid phosphatase 4 [Rosa chinensis]|uniref:purple acid phosphatase 4 n=1 Tax=Rosa chinensis TaxID=74649 RepID=UPI001AD8ECE6|nr:purple acid phosphatase 4 [Rosa chinensis]
MQRFSFPQFLILTACLSLCLVAKADLQPFQQQANADGSLSFLVVGDWGRRGLYNQSKVATQMGIIGEKAQTNFVISTGDNFYDDGLTGPDDPAFNESFSNIYTAPSLHIPWYIVLGNHDYRGDALAQLKIDRRWFCSRPLFIIYSAIAEFFFVDTTPFVDDYFTNPKEHVYDWRGVLPREDYLPKLLKDLDVTLKNSRAKWKIVIGHHTIRSAGHHGNTTDLVTHLLPVLKANKIDFYINGHDHCLQHISDPDSYCSKIEFFTSGGGSKAWRGDIKWWDPRELKLYYDGQGFMSVQMTKTRADIQFYDVSGNVLHKWRKSKEVNSATHRFPMLGRKALMYEGRVV